MAGTSSSSIRPRVLLTRRIPSSAFEKLEARCDVDLNDQPDALLAGRAEAPARRQGRPDLPSSRTRSPPDVLEAAPKLKVVANIAVGYDNIDVAAAKARGIVVTNTPDVLTEAVAEITWGLIFSITRRIVEGDRLVRRGAWKGWALDFMLGTELGGKQLGIIGRGRIGRAVAAKAPAFGMQAVFAVRGAREAGIRRDVARRAAGELGRHLHSRADDGRPIGT